MWEYKYYQASEHEVITSDPRDLEKLKEREGITDTRTIEQMAQIYDPSCSSTTNERRKRQQKVKSLWESSRNKRKQKNTSR